MRLERNVTIEISGRCNARCPWCSTGRATREGRPIRGGFMPPDKLDAILDRLAALGLILDTFHYELFNWGEPLLHPQLPGVIEVMNRRGLHYRLSTNASMVPDLDGVPLHGLGEVVFSMPGFSQASYDAIHGFSFPRILDNIRSIKDLLARNGFTGRTFMSFHIYQFNLHEVGAAARHCQADGLGFMPFLATPNDHPTCMALLTGRLDASRWAAICRHLLLFHLDDMLRQRPPQWQCWQQNKLVLDEQGRLLTCCLLPRDHPGSVLGSVFDLDLAQAMALNKQQGICRECAAAGAGYWMLNPVRPPLLQALLSAPAAN